MKAREQIFLSPLPAYTVTHMTKLDAGCSEKWHYKPKEPQIKKDEVYETL